METSVFLENYRFLTLVELVELTEEAVCLGFHTVFSTTFEQALLFGRVRTSSD